MCAGGGSPPLPLSSRPDAELQSIVNNHNRLLARTNNNAFARAVGFAGPAGEAQRILSERQRQRDELSRIASAREAQVKAQQAEMQRLAKAQKDAQSQQQRTVADLSAQRDAQQKEMAAQRLATQAVGQSLRVLANQAVQTEAPTAPVTRGRATQRAKTTLATNDLRIGSSSRSAGVGMNLGG